MIFSGSMNLTGSFLDDPPIGALFFENDGSMRLIITNHDEQTKHSEQEINSIIIVSEFFQYALSKDEWMKEFVDLSIFKNDLNVTKKYQPVLELIHGGLSNITGSNGGNLLN